MCLVSKANTGDCVCGNICLLIPYIILAFGGVSAFSMIKILLSNIVPCNFVNFSITYFDTVTEIKPLLFAVILDSGIWTSELSQRILCNPNSLYKSLLLISFHRFPTFLYFQVPVNFTAFLIEIWIFFENVAKVVTFDLENVVVGYDYVFGADPVDVGLNLLLVQEI